MRFNCHAHVFNFLSVFTAATRATLVNRLSNEKWPREIQSLADKVLSKLLNGDTLDENKLLALIVSDLKADAVLKQILSDALSKLPSGVGVSIDGDLSALPIALLRSLISKVDDHLRESDPLSDVSKAEFSDVFAFFALGITPTIEGVAEKLIAASGPDTGVVALTLDITAGGEADAALFKKQLRDTSLATLRFPGRILPFVAVNTLRKDHFELMRDALETQGYVGVKLYPSLGYSVGSPEMLKVFEYCAKNSTPILLHCNQGGFKRDNASAELCNPVHWVKILAAFPSLKVCFGHFGGGDCFSTSSPQATGWAAQILDFIHNKNYNVYADISYHDEPMDGSPAEGYYFKKLKDLLAEPIVRERILFGTDFPLIRQRATDDHIWSYFEQRFSAAEMRQMSELNPLTFLGLPDSDGSGALENVQRHVRFLASHNNEVKEIPAAWVLASVQSATASQTPVIFHPNPFGINWTVTNKCHWAAYRYFRNLMSDGMLAAVGFIDAGAFELRGLRNYTITSATAANINERLEVLAAGLEDKIEEMGGRRRSGITITDSRDALKALFKDPDSTIAAFGPVVERLFQF